MPAEPRTAPTGEPLEPYDPLSVASIVRYRMKGPAGGEELEREVEGTKRLVYEYKYGEGAGNTTYQARPRGRPPQAGGGARLTPGCVQMRCD